jgi:hypothetical protein
MKVKLKLIGIDGGDKRTRSSLEVSLTTQKVVLGVAVPEVGVAVPEEDIRTINAIKIGDDEFKSEEISIKEQVEFLDSIGLDDILDKYGLHPENSYYSKRGFKSLKELEDEVWEFDVPDGAFDALVSKFKGKTPANINGPYLDRGDRHVLGFVAWGVGLPEDGYDSKIKRLRKLGYLKGSKLTDEGKKRCIELKVRFTFDFKKEVDGLNYHSMNGGLCIGGPNYIQFGKIPFESDVVKGVLVEVRKEFKTWYEELRALGNGVEPNICIEDWMDEETKKLLLARGCREGC